MPKVAPERRIVPPTDAPIQLGAATLWALPAAHYTVEQDTARGQRWLSFLLQLNGVTFFHGGDTLIYPGQLERLQALPRADIALMACNGRDAIRDAQQITGNLYPDEAVWLAGQLGWGRAARRAQ